MKLSYLLLVVKLTNPYSAMNNQIPIIDWLKTTSISLSEISNKTGISRNTLYNWIDGKPIREKNLNKILKSYTKEIFTDTKPEERMDEKYRDQLIELQTDKINRLERKLAEKNALINHESKERPKTLDEISDMLHDSSKQFSFVFYNSDKPMSCTRKGILRNVNPALCKLLGYTEDEMLGKNLLEFVHPDDHKRAVKEIKKSTRNIQLRVRKSNGKYCNMDIRAQEFGVNGNVFSVGLITCCEKGCPDI